MHSYPRTILIVFVFLFCAVATAGVCYFSKRAPTYTTVPAPLNATSTPAVKSSFSGLTLEGKAGYVLDVKTGEALFSLNGTLALPVASLTKLMTAVAATKDLEPTHEVVITRSALATYGESGLYEGEVWELEELTKFMLVTSSNDGAAAIREAYENELGGSFIVALNAHAERIGLSTMNFVNETGLDGAAVSETNVGSARDVAFLFAYILKEHPELIDSTRYESTTFRSLSGSVHTAKNTNELANEVPWSVGAKTGFTDRAGGNLGVAFDLSVGRPAVAVVMQSSREGRFDDVDSLITAALASVQQEQ